MLKDMVRAINLEFRQQIRWPLGNHMVESMLDFQRYCNLPGVVGAINRIHFEIQKLSVNPKVL